MTANDALIILPTFLRFSNFFFSITTFSGFDEFVTGWI